MPNRFKASCCFLFAAAMLATFSLQAATTEFSLSTGYRHTTLKHRLNCNIVPTLEVNREKGLFKHDIRLHSWNVKAGIKTLTDENCYLQGSVSGGWLIKRAKEEFDTNQLFFVQPSLQRKETRKMKKHGHTCDFNASIGKKFDLSERCSFIPHIGYSHSEMTLNKFQDLAFFQFPATAKQKVIWSGPFIAIDLPILFANGLSITPGVEYHYSKYRNKLSGDDELRIRYTGKRWGHICKARIQASYALNTQLSCDLGYQFEYKQAKPKKMNIQALELYTGSANGKVKQQDHCLSLGISYLF